ACAREVCTGTGVMFSWNTKAGPGGNAVFHSVFPTPSTKAVEMWTFPWSQRAQKSVRIGLERTWPAAYSRSCTEHGARVGRSSARGQYAEAATPRRKVNGWCGRKRHRLGEPLVRLCRARSKNCQLALRSQIFTQSAGGMLPNCLHGSAAASTVPLAASTGRE